MKAFVVMPRPNKLAPLFIAIALIFSPQAESVIASTTTADWLRVDAGITHTCAIKTNNSLWCWGDNSDGQIGNGDPQGQMCIGGAQANCRDKTKKLWVEVSAGNSFTCAIEKTTKKLFCWGKNSYGELGHATSNTPVEVTGGGQWNKVVAGSGSTCAIKIDQSLWCWGRDDRGQLGDSASFTGKSVPTKVSATGSDGNGKVIAIATKWIDVDVEEKQACGVGSNFVMYCWGQWGWVGLQGSNALNGTPARVMSGDISFFSDWSQVATGRYHVCGIRSGGQLYCFGAGTAGQIGYGDGLDKKYPVRIMPTKTWTGIDLGLDYSCAIRSDNQLWCWGDNYFGQPGQFCGSEGVSSGPRMCDTSNQAYPSPVREQTMTTGWTATMDAGGFHSCVIKSSGRLYCWGKDMQAQLGFRSSICLYDGSQHGCFLYSPPYRQVENQ